MFIPNSSDAEVLQYVSDATVERFRRLNICDDYKLVITGTVGSGKSTLCESIAAIFRKVGKTLDAYPEYIARDPAANMLLEQKLTGVVSPLTFQSFVLDIWEHTLRQPRVGNFALYERCVDDSVLCFANNDNRNNTMTDGELLTLFDRLKRIDNKYDIPSYFSDNPFTCIVSDTIDSNLQTIVGLIENDITNNVHHRIIGLSVSGETSYQRILKRGRKAESNYTTKDAQDYADRYERLYDIIRSSKHGIQRFLDMGRL